jgi:hypothetical protein
MANQNNWFEKTSIVLDASQIMQTMYRKRTCIDEFCTKWTNPSNALPNTTKRVYIYTENLGESVRIIPYSECTLMSIKQYNTHFRINEQRLWETDHFRDLKNQTHKFVRVSYIMPFMLPPLCLIVESYLGIDIIFKFTPYLKYARLMLSDQQNIYQIADLYNQHNNQIIECNNSDLKCNSQTLGTLTYGELGKFSDHISSIDADEPTPETAGLWLINFDAKIKSIPKYRWIEYIEAIYSNIDDIGTIKDDASYDYSPTRAEIRQKNKLLHFVRRIMCTAKVIIPEFVFYTGIFHSVSCDGADPNNCTSICHK